MVIPVQDDVQLAERTLRIEVPFHAIGNIVERKQNLFHVYTGSRHLKGKTTCQDISVSSILKQKKEKQN